MGFATILMATGIARIAFIWAAAHSGEVMTKKRYSVPSGATAEDWTVEETEAALLTLIPCENELSFDRACGTVAEALIRGGRRDHRGRVNPDFVRRWLWGLAVGAKGYVQLTDSRPSRVGVQPWTWCEIQIIKWASTTKSQEATMAESSHKLQLCALLSRSLEEVEAAWKKYGPAKGRKGLVN